jgi:hypothetical protein
MTLFSIFRALESRSNKVMYFINKLVATFVWKVEFFFASVQK